MDGGQPQYVVVVRPQVKRQGDHSWKAWYPKSDWYVTADSKEVATQKLRDEFERRLNAGEVDNEPDEALLEEHLANPIPGVYAINRDVYMRMRTGPNFRGELDALVERIDAERKRT